MQGISNWKKMEPTSRQQTEVPVLSLYPREAKDSDGRLSLERKKVIHTPVQRREIRGW